MSRSRPTPLLITSGVLLLILVGLFFLTHRPLEPKPEPSGLTSTGESLADASTSATQNDTSTPPTAPADSDLALNATAAELSQKLSTRFTRPDTRAHEAVLLFKNADGYHRFLARAAQVGVIIVGQIDSLNVVRVRVRAYDTFAADLLARAADYGGISANTFVTMPPPPAERLVSRQIGVGNNLLATLGVPAGTDRSTWGRGITVAVLDGGASPDSTLGSRLSYHDIGLGYAGTGASGLHGTSVASIVAGSAPDAAGIAPSATILSIRVIDTDDKADVFTVSQGIVAAVDTGAQLINLSLGGYSTSDVLTRAITYAADHGVVIVAAAGNDGINRLVWPAADPRIVSVGATDATGRLAAFSNSGPQLQLTAPGIGIQAATLANQRALFSGTSAATPVVTGALAALLSQTPGLTASQAVTLLQTYSDDGGAAGTDSSYGSGTVDLGWVLARADTRRTDTAISSHHYDADTASLEVVVQNRSAHPVANLTLNIELNDRASTLVIPALTAGQSLAVPIPLDAATAAAPITLRTRLDNPEGVIDAAPANNTRASRVDLSAR
jgi:subtilisin family serine protease